MCDHEEDTWCEDQDRIWELEKLISSFHTDHRGIQYVPRVTLENYIKNLQKKHDRKGNNV